MVDCDSTTNDKCTVVHYVASREGIQTNPIFYKDVFLNFSWRTEFLKNMTYMEIISRSK